ncbi:uncharacterized protein LOC144175944 [Haemaphysalis longicornis]
MTHVLVKWLTDDKWDVYPVRALVDPAVGIRVMTDDNALTELKGTVQDVSWKDGEQPARARILNFGKPAVLERKRAKLAAANAATSAEAMPSEQMEEKEGPCCACSSLVTQLEEENKQLQVEVAKLKRAQDAADNVAETSKVLKRAHKVLGRIEGKKPEDVVIPCPKVDIGGGVIIEQAYLDQLLHACASGPGKFARALLRHVFSPEELRGKTLFGGKGKAQGDTTTKPGLDPVRVKAVVGYTGQKFPGVSASYIKNSLSSLLNREIK